MPVTLLVWYSGTSTGCGQEQVGGGRVVVAAVLVLKIVKIRLSLVCWVPGISDGFSTAVVVYLSPIKEIVQQNKIKQKQ